ncbi:MAG: hypothetical protein ABGZ36_26700, partial [Actinomycetota bacterium]
LSIPFDGGDNDYGYSILSLADGRILVAGRTGNDIAMVRLLGDSNQDALAVNLTPVNSVPGTQTTQIDTALAFTDFRGNLISISDADAGSNMLQVTLAGTNGTVTLINPDPDGALTYSTGDGTEDVSMTFTGTIADINTALQWVVFRPDGDFTGTAGLTITTDDQGYFGTGGAKTDADTIDITVAAVPDFDPSPTWTTLPGALDPDFGSGGKQVLSVSAGIDFIYDMKLLADGKILAVGAVNDHFGVLRFNADLTLDTTFGTSGVVENDFGGNGKHARTLTIHPDGTLLVGGDQYLARYTADGALVGTFGDAGKVQNGHTGSITGVAVQPDGKILVTGYTNDESFRLSRYDDDGTLEWNKNYQIRSSHHQFDNERAVGLFVHDDGDIVIAGAIDNDHEYASEDRWGTIRVNTYGGLESTYESNFESYEDTSSILRLPDGKFLVVGYSKSPPDVRLTRHHRDGSLDTTFGSSGTISFPVLNAGDYGYRATLQADGRILVSGYAHNGSNHDISVTRLSYDGALDTSFDGDGVLSIPFDGGDNDYGYSILSLADGRILVAGRTGNDIAMVRLLGDSNQDALAVNLTPVNSVPGTQTTQIDTALAFTDFRGNLISISDADAGSNMLQVTLAGTNGTVTLINPDPDGALTYSTGDGTEDVSMTFTGTIADINTALQWVVFRPDGDFTGTAGLTITTDDQGYFGTGGAKTDADTIDITVAAVPDFDPSPTWTTLPGALDPDFGSGGKQVLSVSAGIDFIYDMKLLADGKILAVGAVNDHFGVLRFNADLTLDTTFGTSGVVENDFGGNGKHARTLTIHPDGTLLVGGDQYLARYTADGALVGTFGDAGKVQNGHTGSITGVAVQPDGKILVTGYTNDESFRLSRYDDDGTLEWNKSYQINFNHKDFDNERAVGLFVHDDGDIVIAGAIDNDHVPTYSAYDFWGAIRVNTYGVLEATYQSNFESYGDTNS